MVNFLLSFVEFMVFKALTVFLQNKVFRFQVLDWYRFCTSLQYGHPVILQSEGHMF